MQIDSEVSSSRSCDSFLQSATNELRFRGDRLSVASALRVVDHMIKRLPGLWDLIVGPVPYTLHEIEQIVGPLLSANRLSSLVFIDVGITLPFLESLGRHVYEKRESVLETVVFNKEQKVDDLCAIAAVMAFRGAPNLRHFEFSNCEVSAPGRRMLAEARRQYLPQAKVEVWPGLEEDDVVETEKIHRPRVPRKKK
jgi:hypothetical protein